MSKSKYANAAIALAIGSLMFAVDSLPQSVPAPIDFANTDLRDVQLTRTDRLLRIWQYQYQLLEQPAFLSATIGGTTQTIPNPNYWLQQHSLVFNFSELFPATTNLPQIVQAAYDNDPRVYTTPRPLIRLNKLCPRLDVMECLAGGGDGWGSFARRVLSGASLTFSVAQRDAVQQGVLLNLSASQGWSWNGQVDFNPASLFVTSANWKNAASLFGKGQDGNNRNIEVNKNSPAYQCFAEQKPVNGGTWRPANTGSRHRRLILVRSKGRGHMCLLLQSQPFS